MYIISFFVFNCCDGYNGLFELKVGPSGCECNTNPTGKPATGNEPSGMETSCR